MDDTDQKKSKATYSMLPITEHTGTHLDENDEPACKSLLTEADFDKISKLVAGTLKGELQSLVSSIVDGVLGGLKAQITELQKENSFL